MILYLLKPFGLDNYDKYAGNLLPVCLGYAVITFFAELAFQRMVREVAKRRSTWMVRDALLVGMLFWLFVGVVNFFYSVVIFHISSEHIVWVFLYFIYWTVLIGIFLSFISTLINYNRYLKSELALMIHKYDRRAAGHYTQYS